ncbi:Hypothetical protein SMAX5B_000196 [Scophthalmus maximus]|uniref:Uncharacterized protein n=1 Tax=Scophthalmus maximus TaxID=52904 RepID=A0A2U9CUJ1_SCOMX|nr:Hypothetical protein SMAX5B_000196 [Scophthalmus maximus]
MGRAALQCDPALPRGLLTVSLAPRQETPSGPPHQLPGSDRFSSTAVHDTAAARRAESEVTI